MTTILKKYPVFEDNQVLTSSQLNNVVEYLDQQNRLTRVSLIGVGILCGLDLSCTESANDEAELTISCGVGVTSQGFLINVDGCTATQIRTYTLPEKVDYSPFQDPLSNLQDIEIKELLTANADFDEQDDIAVLKKEDLTDMAVLLFVECLDIDLKSCLGKSCDQLGIDRFLNIRKLLISKSDIEIINSRTEGGYQDAQFPDRFTLPKLVMPRPLFPPGSLQSQYYFYYANNYLDAINISATLPQALETSYEVYEPLLEPVYGSNPFLSATLTNIFQNWDAAIQGGTLPYSGIQYFYGYFKDLIQAYCEFREKACLLTALCCPDMDRFPKHLILGCIDTDAGGVFSEEYRHGFTQPPVYSNQKELTQTVIQLHQKLICMIEGFDPSRLDIEVGEKIEIKVTPSCEKKSLLSERSIPYYYDTNSGSSFPKTGTFEDTWRASIKSRFGRPLLSYDKHELNATTKTPDVTPLDFELDPYDFLRIEGHLGKNVNAVMAELNYLKESKNLAFDVKAVYLGNNGLEMDIPECLCSDLQPEYSIWRTKTIYCLKSILALTTRIRNLIAKKDSLNGALLNDLKVDRSQFKSASTIDPTSISKASGSMLSSLTSEAGPIKINRAKLTNFSDIEIDVNRDNWHLAGKQLLDGFDRLKVAEKAPNDFKNVRAFNEPNTPEYYFDFFNQCLCLLIDSMTLNLKDFSLERWKKHYQCTFQTHIKIMNYLATRTDNAVASMQTFLIIFIYCQIFKVLTKWGIYPYISIGVISQTLEFRKKKFLESLQFSKFLEKNPGAEHKAGVAPGDTFLLLYLTEELLDPLTQTPDDPTTGPDFNNFEKFQEISQLINDFENTVVGDFTLPYTCCDDCSDMPNTAEPLDPIALPFCGMVAFETDDSASQTQPYFNVFKPLEIKTLNHVYEKDSYYTQIIGSPKFGNIKITRDEDSTYEFKIENGVKGAPLKIEKIVYVVDSAITDEIYKSNPETGMLIEELEYEYRKADFPNEVVCKSTITIYIPLISRDLDQQDKTATVTGKVFLEGKPLLNARVVALEMDEVPEQFTTDSGDFTFSEIKEGEVTFEVTRNGLDNNDQITIVKKLETATILSPRTDIGVINVSQKVDFDFGTVDFDPVFTVLDVSENSTGAIKVANYYVNNTNLFKSEIAVLAKLDNSSVKPTLLNASREVKAMAETEKITATQLNSKALKSIQEIDDLMEKASPAEKAVLREASKNVMLTYLQRLSLVQPKTLTKTSTKTLAKLNGIMTGAKYPDIKTDVQEWQDKSVKNVPDSYLNQLQSHLKLK